MEVSAYTFPADVSYCLRLMPISATCASNMESLVRLAKRLLPPHFDDEEHQDPKTVSCDPSFATLTTVPHRNKRTLQR